MKKNRYLNGILTIATVQLIWLKSAPYAVLNDAVNQARKFGGENQSRLVNGLLRSMLDGREQWSKLIPEDKYNLPDWLFNSWISTYGEKNVEEIVKKRMSNMSKIKAYTTKMYPLSMSGEFEEIKKLNDELLHVAKEFKLLFPENSQGGKAASLIWMERETFELFNDNFIKSIENISQSIIDEDSFALVDNFNIMASNCGTCHKKFRN